MLEPIVDAFEAEAAQIRFGTPSIPYISNVTGTWITADEARDPAYWAKHAVQTARFSDALSALWQFTDPVLLEAGPGKTLSVLASQHPKRRADSTAVSSIRHEYENEPDPDFLWRSIGRLWLSGIRIDWDKAPSGSSYRKVALPTYPFERQIHWLGPIPAAPLATAQTRTVEKNPNPAEWFYAPSWRQTLPRAIGKKSATSGRYLVLADASNFAAALVARLEASGHEVVTVRQGPDFGEVDARNFVMAPENARNYAALISALVGRKWIPDRIVHAWNITGPADAPRDVTGFDQAQGVAFYSLLYLAKALAAHNLRDEIALFVLSDRLHDISGVEPSCAEKATLLGPCMVIRQEYPNVRVRSIDVDAHDDPVRRERAADLVVRELLDPDSSLCVAHRNGQRWIQAYERAALPAFPECGAQFRTGGVYLITGGLGTVGTVIAEYLAGRYQARLGLVGRSALPERIEAIRRLEALGAEVCYASADVADEAELRRAIDQVIDRFGALHGVIHAAGVIGPGANLEIKDCTPESCGEAFHAKAGGALALKTVLAGRPLDFCLLLSSMASVLGGIGHSGYASANLYLDALAVAQSRASNVPWLAVDSDFWRVDEKAPADTGLGATLNHLGMNASEATAALETALGARCAGRLLVSTGDLEARIDQWVRLESLDSPHSTAAETRTEKRTAKVDCAATITDPTERRVAQIWQAALGLDAIGAHQTFAELGGHSLLAIRIVGELRKAFQVDLAVRALFDAPTVAQLSRHIREQVAAEIDSLTEQEAQSLLAG